MSLPLGGNVAFQSSSVTQGQADFSGGQVTASLGSLAAGAQATLTVIVQASTVGTLSFTATVSSDEADPTPGDNSASVTIVVQPVIDLAVAIAANPSPVAVGQNLVYTVTATNQGPDPATAVTLSDILPDGVTFVSATSSLGSPPVLTDGTLVAAIGTLIPGAVGNHADHGPAHGSSRVEPGEFGLDHRRGIRLEPLEQHGNRLGAGS